MAYDGSIKFDTKIDNSGFEKGISGLKKTMVGLGATLGVAKLGKEMLEVGSNFEEAMSSVAAISMATGEDFEMLSNAAKEMGETTKYSATQAANALEYLSLAGYSAEESVQALPQVLNLAAAGGMDLAYASDLLTDSMAVMGLGIEDMANFSDQLAMAASKSNTSVQQLGEAVLVAGGQAKLAGMSVDEMNTALGILADKGIKGSEGGTALRNTLKNLYTPTNNAASALKQLGVSTTTASGELRPMQDVLKDLQASLNKLTEADKINAMGEIFDTRTIAAASALLDDCNGRWDELNGYLNDCDGAAEQMAETMNDNLKGQMTLAASAAEGLGIAIYEGIQDPLKEAVKAGAASLSELTTSIRSGELKGSLENLGKLLGGLASALINLGNTVLPPVISVLGFLGEHLNTLVPIIISSVAAVKTWSIASTIVPIISKMVSSFAAAKTSVLAFTAVESAATVAEYALGGAMTAKEIIVGALTGKITLLTAAQSLLNIAMEANPIGVVITALAILGGVIGGVTAAIVNSTEAQKQENEALQRSREEVDSLIQKNSELVESIDSTKSAWEENINSIESNAEADRELADMLFELSDKEHKTLADKALMKDITDKLNKSVEGLSLSFNEETGALEADKEATYELISAKENMAKKNATFETWTEALKEQNQLEVEQIALENQRADILQKQAELGKQDIANGTRSTEEIQEYQKQLDEINTALEENSKAQEENAYFVEASSSQYQASVADMANVTVKTKDEILSEWQSVAEQFPNTAAGLQDAISSFYKTMQSDVDSYGAEFVAAWGAAIDEGADEAITSVDEFMNHVLNSMNKSSEAGQQGKNIKENFVNNATPIPGDVDFNPTIDHAINDANNYAANNSKKIGETIDEGISEGTENGEGNVTNTTTGVTKDALNEAEILAKAKGLLTGYAMSQGMALGITTGQSLVIQAAIKTATAAITAANNTLDVNSPSKVFKKLGLSVDEGFALGIEKGKKDVITSATDLASTSVTSVKKKLGIHSPAKVFSDIGENVALGLAKGLGDNADKVIAVMNEDVTEGMLDSEKAYFKEKERIEIENYNKEYDKRIANAKDAKEVEEIKQEYIEKAQKEGQDRYLEALKTFAEREKEELDREKDNIKSVYDDIADYTEKKLDSVDKKRESFESKLGSALYLTQTREYIGGEYGSGVKITSLSDISGQTEAITAFGDSIEDVKERLYNAGFSEDSIFSFIDEIANMSVEEGSQFTDLLLGASDEKFKKYISDWEEYGRQAKRIADFTYADEKIDAIEDSCQYMKDSVTAMGLEIPEGFFASGTLSAEKFGEAFVEELDRQFEDIRSRIDNFNISIAPWTSSNGDWTGSPTVSNDNHSTTVYNIYSTSQSEAYAEAKRKSEIDNARGM